MAFSVLLGFFCRSFCMGPFLLGMPNYQAHSGQHGKLGVNWTVTGFTFQKWRTGKQGVSMGVCKRVGGRNQRYNEKVALNRASQPFSQEETTYQYKGMPLRQPKRRPSHSEVLSRATFSTIVL